MSDFKNSWYIPRFQFVTTFVSWCKAIYQCGIACLCDQSTLHVQQLQQIATILTVSPVSTDTCTKHGHTTATELEA